MIVPSGNNTAFQQSAQQAASLPLIGAPGREITRIERRVLPSGRVVELSVRVVTVLRNGAVYSTLEVVDLPQTDCGCAPTSIYDLYSCAKCGRTICSRHVVTCQSCGANHCSCCLSALAVNGSATIVCRLCGKAITTPRWLKWIKKMLGFGA